MGDPFPFKGMKRGFAKHGFAPAESEALASAKVEGWDGEGFRSAVTSIPNPARRRHTCNISTLTLCRAMFAESLAENAPD
jgi:hypothetical protein